MAKTGSLIALALIGGGSAAALLAPGNLTAPLTGGAVSARSGVATASSSAEVMALVKAAPRELTIRLRPGLYEEIVVRTRPAAGMLTLESADPANPAVVSRLKLNDAHQITIRNLVVKAPAPLPKGDHLVTIRNATDVTIDSLKFIGADVNVDSGLLLRGGESLRILRSDFTGFRYGLSMNDVREVRIEGNEFHHLRTDAVRGGGVSDLLVAGNVIGDFLPAPTDHPDGIQLWSKGETVAARNIVLRDNLMVRGAGGAFQGIFVRDNNTKLPFEDIEISGNLVIGSMYHGVSVNGVTRGRIVDNEVVAFPDAKAWILLARGDDVQLTGNRAMRFITNKSSGVRDKGNKITDPTTKKLRARVERWLQTKPALRDRRGPYLQSLLSSLTD